MKANPLFRIVRREPLVHFLALGALIFAANAVLHRSVPDDNRRITITKADVDRLRALHAQQWGAALRDDDASQLVDDYVRAEVLYREGTALGLNGDDAVLRNRIIQKMEFLIQDPAAVPEPSETEIAAYYRDHQERYRVPAELAFSQIYFSPSLRGAHAEADGRAALARLRMAASGRAVAQSERGDPCMLPSAALLQRRDAVEKDFGPDFAEVVFALPAGSWEGPIGSALGWHLVQVVEQVPAHLPALADIRDRVRTDLVAARQRRGMAAAYARIRARYQVVVDHDALGTDQGSIASLEPR